MPPQQLDAAAGHSKESRGGAAAGRASPPESSPITAAPGHAEAQLLPDRIRAGGSAGVQQHRAGIEAGAGAHTEQAVQQRQAGGAHDLWAAVGQSSGMPCRTSQQAGSRLRGGCARRVERRAAGCCHGGVRAAAQAWGGQAPCCCHPPSCQETGQRPEHPEQPAMAPWPGQWQQGPGCAPHPPRRALQWCWQPPLEPQLPAAPRLLAKWKAPRPGQRGCAAVPAPPALRSSACAGWRTRWAPIRGCIASARPSTPMLAASRVSAERGASALSARLITSHHLSVQLLQGVGLRPPLCGPNHQHRGYCTPTKGLAIGADR